MTTTELMDSRERMEAELKIHKENVDKADALKRLLDNPDFKLVIQQGFLESMPKVLAIQLSHALPENHVAKLTRDVHAIGYFHNYITEILNEGAKSRSFTEASVQELKDFYGVK